MINVDFIKRIFLFFLVLFLLNNSLLPNGESITCYGLSKTLYVGGTGNNNYSSIQNAIDNASNGDSIYVYKGTYQENIVIYKSLTLTGDDRRYTIINAIQRGDVVNINTNHVTLSGFTIENSVGQYAGISLTNNSRYCEISNNQIISNNWDGISLFSSSNNIIKNNIISYNSDGINLNHESNENTIIENTISDNYFYGIYIQDVHNNNIYGNDFLSNGQNAHDEGDNIWDDGWHGNFWDDYEERYPFSRKILLKGIWSSPYEIPGGLNQDYYPIIKPVTENKDKSLINHFIYRYNLLNELFIIYNNYF